MKLFDKIFNRKSQSEPSMLWHADGIYLQDAEKQVKAVCSNNKIAYFMAECVNEHFAKAAENASIASVNAEKAELAAKEAVEMAKRAKMEAELASRTINIIPISSPTHSLSYKPTPASPQDTNRNEHLNADNEQTAIQDVTHMSRLRTFQNFVEDAYYLYVAINKAQIPVTTIGLAFMEKAFHKFCKSMTVFFKAENIKIHDSDGNELHMEIPDEVNNVEEKQKDN